MVENSLTVRDLLTVNGSFDPLNIDTSEIKVLSDSLPQDGNIDTTNAEVLATKYLRGADMCAELLAIATAHVQRTSTIMKSEYSNAALVRAEEYFATKNNGVRPAKITDKMRTLYADMDPNYVEACDKHNEALAFARWVGGKYDSFTRAHYHCKQILTRGYAAEKTANWERDITGNKETEAAEEKEDDCGW